MPFILGPDGRPILQCINHSAIKHDAAENGTTMRAEEEWNTLLVVNAPTHIPMPGTIPGAEMRGKVNFGRGETVRCYICTVCGYVELYAGTIIAPTVWQVG